MTEDALIFFEGHAGAVPLYAAFEKRVAEEITGVRIRVLRSQISFYNRYLFACVSFVRPCRKREMPPAYITVTFGLNRREDSPRIAAATEPYPDRWTHHVVISEPEEIDHCLMAWIKEAAEFSARK